MTGNLNVFSIWNINADVSNFDIITKESIVL